MAKSKPKKVSGSKSLKRFVTKRNFMLTVLVVVVSLFLYNKYLDWRNVENMKQLKAAFEQLERDIERDTNLDITSSFYCINIEEKFSSRPACGAFLSSRERERAILFLEKNTPSILNKKSQCANYLNSPFKFTNKNDVFYTCYPLIIRSSVVGEINKLYQ